MSDSSTPSTSCNDAGSSVRPKVGFGWTIQSTSGLYPGNELNRNLAYLQIQLEALNRLPNDFLLDEICRAQRRMARKRHFPLRREDTHIEAAVALLRRLNKRRFGVVRLTGQPLHFIGADRALTDKYRELIAGERLFSKNIDDVKLK